MRSGLFNSSPRPEKKREVEVNKVVGSFKQRCKQLKMPDVFLKSWVRYKKREKEGTGWSSQCFEDGSSFWHLLFLRC